jgi:hypothetical protein
MFGGLILFFVCCILFFSVDFFKNSGINPPFISVLFAVKIFSGLCLLIIYTYFYADRKTGDVFKYLDDSKIIWQYSKSNLTVFFKILFGIDNENKQVISVLNHLDHWYLDGNANFINDSRLIIRFNLFLYPFSQGNQYIHLVLLGLWSFSGQIALFKTFVAIFYEKTKALVAVFFLPSFVFWSSGILKEGVLIGFLGFFSWYSFRTFQKITLSNSVKLFMMWVGIFFSKFYIAFCLLPLIISIVINQLTKGKSIFIKSTFVSIIIALIIISFYSFFDSSIRLLADKQKQFINVAKGGYFVEQCKDTIRIDYEIGKKIILLGKDSGYFDSFAEGYEFVRLKDTKEIKLKKGKANAFRILKVVPGAKSNIEISEIYDLKSFLTNIPEFVINVFVRPLPNEVNNLFQYLNLIENFVFLIVILLSFIWFKKPTSFTFFWIANYLIFSLILFTVIGATTPVIGAIVRYKIPALPFLWMMILFVIDEKKMRKYFTK